MSVPTNGFSVVAGGLGKQVLSYSMIPVVGFDTVDGVRSPAPSLLYSKNKNTFRLYLCEYFFKKAVDLSEMEASIWSKQKITSYVVI